MKIEIKLTEEETRKIVKIAELREVHEEAVIRDALDEALKGLDVDQECRMCTPDTFIKYLIERDALEEVLDDAYELREMKEHIHYNKTAIMLGGFWHKSNMEITFWDELVDSDGKQRYQSRQEYVQKLKEENEELKKECYFHNANINYHVDCFNKSEYGKECPARYMYARADLYDYLNKLEEMEQ
jgi:hypothetical protein